MAKKVEQKVGKQLKFILCSQAPDIRVQSYSVSGVFKGWLYNKVR
jgi:hypothetical protein